MTGTTEQAPESGVKGSTTGTSAANGTAEVREPAPAEPPLVDFDGIGADALLQDGDRENGAILPKPRPRVVSVPMSLGAGTAMPRQQIPIAPI